MSRVRVLIVDDRPIFRAGVQGMLRDFPQVDIVGEAVTGRQAVDRSRTLKPDVILMDLNMPDMGGIAATRAIKEEDPERVILALTVSEAEEDIVEMVAAGASGSDCIGAHIVKTRPVSDPADRLLQSHLEAVLG